MFSSILSRIAVQQEQLNRQADHLEAGAREAAAALANHLADDLNEEIRQVYDTQTLLERESQQLRQELADFNTQVAGWGGRIRALHSRLKDVGDVENYVSVLSRQAQLLARAVSEARGALPSTPAAASPGPPSATPSPEPPLPPAAAAVPAAGGAAADAEAAEALMLPVSRRASR